MANLLNKESYTDSTFNTGELMTFGQNTMIQLLTQFQDCKTTEFFFAIDNRLSDPSFFYGTVANIGTQVGTAIGYYVLSTQLTGDAQTMFVNLWESSSIFHLYNNTYAQFSAGDFDGLGTTLTSFMLSIVNYKAPNVNTGRSTQ